MRNKPKIDSSNAPGKLYAVRQAHDEALKVNKAYDLDRAKRIRATFGFCPAKKWTVAQTARAATFKR